MSSTYSYLPNDLHLLIGLLQLGFQQWYSIIINKIYLHVSHGTKMFQAIRYPFSVVYKTFAIKRHDKQKVFAIHVQSIDINVLHFRKTP